MDVEQRQPVGSRGFESASGLRLLSATTLMVVSASLFLALLQFFVHKSAISPDRPECPHDRDTVWIAGKYTNVPEFHDCQRLIVNNGASLKYGSLAAVFLGQDVIENRKSVTFKIAPTLAVLPILVPGSGGPGNRTAVPMIAGEVVVNTTPGSTTRDTTSAVATPWVEVVSEDAYPTLGIGVGYNCLFVVEHKKGDGTVVKTDAKMVNAGAKEKPCTAAGIQSATGTPLGLFANPTPAGAAIPAVTRWVWSPSDSTQLIGIPCGANWCDVGPHTGPNAVGSAFPQAVKGWYDEQFLADYTGGSAVVSTAMGTVFPEPGLDTRDSAYYSKKFVVVAHVAMTAALAKYENRYAFGSGAANGPLSSMATIALCYGDRDNCLPATAPPSVTCKIAPQTMPNLPADAAVLHPWWARVTSPDGSKVNYFCTGYRGLPKDFKMPGVVRWRWRAKDETVWVPCAQGCCEVDVSLT
jgi:hypothetical protein